MKGFVGIGRADHVETAITEATAGLKKADFLILIAPFSKIEAAAALLGIVGRGYECADYQLQRIIRLIAQIQ